VRQRPVSAPHLYPVIFVGRSTSQAYLVIAPVVIGARPSEPMLTGPSQKLLPEIQCVTA
jgi:hypothetical protein